jgi:hypothetical protein
MNSLTRARSVYSCLLLALLSFALVSCSTVSPEAKAGLRKVVVLNGVSTELTRFHVGMTVFTNKGHLKTQAPELRGRVDELLVAELKRRLPQAQIVVDKANSQKLSGISHYKEVNALQASVSQQTGADAILVLTSHGYYPYGTPSHMSAENGLWHGGSLQSGGYAVESFLSMRLVDAKTQKTIGQGFPSAATEQVDGPFPPEGSDFSAVHRSKIVDTVMKSITAKVLTTFKQMGL